MENYRGMATGSMHRKAGVESIIIIIALVFAPDDSTIVPYQLDATSARLKSTQELFTNAQQHSKAFAAGLP